MNRAPNDAAPLGGWPRLYVVVCVCAVLVMLVLWWFSSHFNIAMEARR